MSSRKTEDSIGVYAGLEGLRFIASFGIVLFHYSIYLDQIPREFSSYAEYMSLFVDLFFVISGFVIALTSTARVQTPGGYFAFLKRRIARLYPLHIATLTFYVIIGVLFELHWISVAVPLKYEWNTLLPQLLMIHGWGFTSTLSFNHVSWSISSELFVYMVFPVILLVMGQFRIAILGIVALFVASIIMSESLIGHPLTSLTWDFSIVRALPSFALGVFVHKYAEKWEDILPRWLLVTTLHGALVLLVAMMTMRSNPYAILLVIYILFVSAVLCDRQRIMTITSVRPVAYLGRLTYSTYMLHTVVGTIVVSGLFPRLFEPSLPTRIVAVLCATLVTMVAAYVSYHYFETPLRERITSWRPMFFRQWFQETESKRVS
jgi:peptidoglycan/LPS O-acetylase OafA/YrhL